MAGLLITFEGGEAAGKDTQVELLKKKLSEEGYKIYTKPLQEPGTTREGEFVRTWLKHCADTAYSIEHFQDVASQAKDFNFDANELAYGYFLARHSVFRQIIKPLLDQNYILLHNRSIDSTAVYQGHLANPKLLPWIRSENQRIMDSTKVIIQKTYLIDITVDEAHRRLKDRVSAQSDRFDKLNADGFNKIRDGYLAEAKLFPKRIVVIDGSPNSDEVLEILYEKVKAELEKSGITPLE